MKDCVPKDVGRLSSAFENQIKHNEKAIGKIGSSLDWHFMGTWSEDETAEFRIALAITTSIHVTGKSRSLPIVRMRFRDADTGGISAYGLCRRSTQVETAGNRVAKRRQEAPIRDAVGLCFGRFLPHEHSANNSRGSEHECVAMASRECFL